MPRKKMLIYVNDQGGFLSCHHQEWYATPGIQVGEGKGGGGFYPVITRNGMPPSDPRGSPPPAFVSILSSPGMVCHSGPCNPIKNNSIESRFRQPLYFWW